jgi:hypothetical protein
MRDDSSKKNEKSTGTVGPRACASHPSNADHAAMAGSMGVAASLAGRSDPRTSVVLLASGKSGKCGGLPLSGIIFMPTTAATTANPSGTKVRAFILFTGVGQT